MLTVQLVQGLLRCTALAAHATAMQTNRPAECPTALQRVLDCNIINGRSFCLRSDFRKKMFDYELRLLCTLC